MLLVPDEGEVMSWIPPLFTASMGALVGWFLNSITSKRLEKTRLAYQIVESFLKKPDDIAHSLHALKNHTYKEGVGTLDATRRQDLKDIIWRTGCWLNLCASLYLANAVQRKILVHTGLFRAILDFKDACLTDDCEYVLNDIWPQILHMDERLIEK